MKKVYTVRKFIVANSLTEALRNEKKTAVEEIFLDEFNLKSHLEGLLDNKKTNV
jgi:hypothetical protein